MHNLFRSSGKPSVESWEAEIKAAQLELKLHGHEMSPYERNLISREIKRRQDELVPTLGALVIGEWKESINAYQASQEKIKAERTKEINRWDSGKLNTELQTMSTRLKLALDVDVNPLRGQDKAVSVRLREMYNEAMQSGDLHRQRAAVEVIRSAPLPMSDQQERVKINQLTKDAEKAEIELRSTDGTRQAEQEHQQALGNLYKQSNQLDKVSQLLGMGSIDTPFASSPFARAARLVTFPKHLADNDGRPQGEVVIHNENSPEVTGVYWK